MSFIVLTSAEVFDGIVDAGEMPHLLGLGAEIVLVRPLFDELARDPECGAFILQGVDRMSVGDEIWLAAQLSAKGKGRESDPRYRNLCRRLGFGLLGVSKAGYVEVLVAPAAPTPRKDPRRRSRLVEEYRWRQGDPAAGGSTRKPIMTAYRQQALACAAAMTSAPQRPRDLKPSCPDAQKILHRNVYGWFARAERGVYALTATGRNAVAEWRPPSAAITPDQDQLSA